jgi:hypothetical protein
MHNRVIVCQDTQRELGAGHGKGAASGWGKAHRDGITTRPGVIRGPRVRERSGVVVVVGIRSGGRYGSLRGVK